MFKGIRWRIILIYIVLMATAMIVAHFFIVKNLEELNLKNLRDEMTAKTETIISTSSVLNEKSLSQHSKEIETMIFQWGLSDDEKIYVIDMKKEPPMIIASSTLIKPIDIYSSFSVSSVIIDKVKKRERAYGRYEDPNTGIKFLHFAAPILSDNGSLNGILYMSVELTRVYNMLNDATGIIYRAVMISMALTVVLGFFVANGITVPIRDVTKKASLMAKGDFNQEVEVKSDDEIGQLAIMFNILTDKLRRTIGEMELERSKLSTIFSAMQEGVVAVDTSGFIIHANPTAQKILNLPQLAGKTEDNTKLPKELLDFELNPDMSLSIAGTVYRVQVASYKEDDGDEAGKIFVFQDMTREHKLDEMRKEFVANVSHELKTPITTIITYVETILDTNPDPDTSKKFLQTVSREAERMNRIVKDLLVLSNIDYGKSHNKKKISSLKLLIEESVEKLYISIKEKAHTVKLSLDEAEVDMDWDQVERVILNIISNSIKYTDREGKIFISLENDGKFATVRIKDNGIGIPSEDLERVYERFYRVEKGRSREMGGTGLGLSIAKEITESHGGSIQMFSKLGEGTETIVKLELA